MCNISKFLFLLHMNFGKMFTIMIQQMCLIIILLSVSLKTLTYVFQRYVLGHLLMAKKLITPAIKQACLTKNKLYKRYLRHRTDVHLQEYKIYRNRLTSVIRTAKKHILMSYLCIAIIALKCMAKY